MRVVVEVPTPRATKIQLARSRSEKQKGLVRLNLEGEYFGYEGGKLVEYEYLLSGYSED